MAKVLPPEPDALRLATRAGLPDALLELRNALPRAGWETHPEFAGLAAFWMERHLSFRRLCEVLVAETEARLEGRVSPEHLAARVSRLGGALVADLHGHHHVEDDHYFPLLAGMEPGLARGFQILDTDHHVLADWLTRFTGAANAVIEAEGRDLAGALHSELTGFVPMLDRHLTDEEDLIVPILLKTGLR